MRHPLLHTILIAIAAQGCATYEVGEACMPAPTEGCPDPATLQPEDLASPWDCDNTVTEILDTEIPEPKAAFQDGSSGCCYEAEMVDTTPNSDCIVGRPFRHEGESLTAEVEAASTWARIGLAEHASIAAFAKLQLQLMAWGAPSSLLAEVAEAMADEVRHAEIAFELAERYGSAAVVPGRFPFPAAIDPAVSLADLAAAAVTEGCIGETLSAIATRRAAEQCPEADVRELLLVIAADEDRHAALSWAVVAWALRIGGADVRARVLEALQGPHPAPHLELLSASDTQALSVRALHEVIAPAATALLAA